MVDKKQAEAAQVESVVRRGVRSKRAFNLEEGEHLKRSPNKPIIHVNGNGGRAYLWIGNNADGDKACFATLSGPGQLRRLAQRILDALGESA